MKRVNAEGVVLRLTDRGEADQMVTLLTPNQGPIRALARKAKHSVRRFGGRLGLLNRLSFEYSKKTNRSMAFLEDTELIERFPAIPHDPLLFGRAMSIAEVIEATWGEGDPSQGVFNFLIQYLRNAQDGKMNAHRHCLETFRLLEILGHRPILDACASCGKELGKKFRYSVIEGGTVCNDCADVEETKAQKWGGSKPIKIRAETAHTIQAGLNARHEKLGRIKFSEKGRAEAEKLWREHVRALLGRNPRSLEFLSKMEGNKGF